MNRMMEHFRSMPTAMAALTALLSGIAWSPQAATEVTLSDATFRGLTTIVATTNVPLTGIEAAHIVITRPDGSRVPQAKITEILASQKALSIVIDADQFSRITSQGTTIATTAFGSFRASQPVIVRKSGEPSVNGHIIGSSRWTDEGWSTSTTDPDFHDPVTGGTGLYRFVDLTPDTDPKGGTVAWNNGHITSPAYKAVNMLVLFVEFPDRRAADAPAPYTSIPPYMEFLQGSVNWYATSSYGQLRFSLSSPQRDRDLGWIMMSKNAGEYPWGGRTHEMFAYIREACQSAYDHWDVKPDDYDMLLIMPAGGKSGLRNGPSNINMDPGDGEQPNVKHAAYFDRDKQPHYIGTALTAGNDLFRWGYRWLIHEAGHAFGFPDLYMYRPTVNGVRVGSFFYCGGWDMMGNIAGHSTDYLAWHKWKLRWIRDDQVDVVSQSSLVPNRHFITPVETPGGTKMVVVRTGLSTAYVVEFRTRLGVNALDSRGKYSGVLLYRIDASQWEARESNPTAQIISRQFFNDPAVAGPKNLTGVWRPIDNSLDGYDSSNCLWQPGDEFSDPATGVTISVDGITNHDAKDPDNSPYTANDVAAVSVTKTRDTELVRNVSLSHATLQNLTVLAFDTNVELQQRIPIAGTGGGTPFIYVREDSLLLPDHLVIIKGNGSVVPAARITRITVHPTRVEVTLEKGVFGDATEVTGATVATRAYYWFTAGAAVGISIAK
jgi:M6 family metalloprotease-like protein